ncbi:hypothetical protein Syun_017271 [Stephania yunnanensis]|uniref:Uncharacterized protein n=1 Tax=Stephania yunnanensis TaxID=152371 RepID=A0AAP0J6M2_9MAGN
MTKNWLIDMVERARSRGDLRKDEDEDEGENMTVVLLWRSIEGGKLIEVLKEAADVDSIILKVSLVEVVLA